MDRQNAFDLILKRAGVPIDFHEWLIESGFFNAPASIKYHGNYAGGLFDHSFSTMTILLDLSLVNGLAWKNARSPYLIGIFHDICKIDQYVPDPDGKNRFIYAEQSAPGHGDKSVRILDEYYDLTDEEEMCIRYHMGAFCEKDEWPDYTAAVRKWPNLLWTHHADMLAAHVKGI